MTSMTQRRRLVYAQGDHVCAIYSSPGEQLTAAIEYIREGLSRGERCLYVVGEHEPDAFRAALMNAGIDVPREEERGALVLLTKHDGHLKGGSFDAKKMIDMLEAAVADALAAGFTGLCAAGDMTWLLDEAPGSEQIATYEADLNHFYRTSRALGLCLYRKSMPKVLLDHCLATHPVVRVAGPMLLTNPFYEMPELARARAPRAEGIDAKVAHFDAHAGATSAN